MLDLPILEKYPNVLAIAASAALCSLALRTPDGVQHWQSSDQNQHSEQILPAVALLLAQAGIEQPDLIAVDIGPGAFTSVRVACGVAQGLALGWGCKVLPVQSLTALAQQAHALNPAANTVACIIDARMNECYVAHYSVLNGGLFQTAAPSLVAYAAVMNLDVDCVIGNASAVLPQWSSLAASVLDALPCAQGVLQQACYEPLTSAMLPECVQPLYVRNQVALTAAERAAGQVL
jgi:tRNA threonylcarbamoyladenosine biosynthesis protein TsaB